MKSLVWRWVEFMELVGEIDLAKANEIRRHLLKRRFEVTI